MCDLTILQTLPSLGYPLVMYSYSRCSTCELHQQRNFEIQFQATSFRWSDPEFCFISLPVWRCWTTMEKKLGLWISSLNALHTSLPSTSCLKDCSPLRKEIILEVWIYSWCFSLASTFFNLGFMHSEGTGNDQPITPVLIFFATTPSGCSTNNTRWFSEAFNHHRRSSAPQL